MQIFYTYNCVSTQNHFVIKVYWPQYSIELRSFSTGGIFSSRNPGLITPFPSSPPFPHFPVNIRVNKRRETSVDVVVFVRPGNRRYFDRTPLWAFGKKNLVALSFDLGVVHASLELGVFS